MSGTSHLSGVLLSILNVDRLLVFGDSHSAVFANIENVEVVHVGPATAYNLAKAGTTTQAREKILARLANTSPKDAAVLLCFGEIDCRMHVVRVASSPEATILQAVNATVERFFAFVQTIMSQGFCVLLYGPAGSGTGWNENFPTVGREQERNYATYLFNSHLAQKCRQFGLVFASLHDLVLDQQSWLTRSEFLNDGCHLNGHPNTDPELQSIVLSRLLSCLQSYGHPSRSEYQSAANQSRINHAIGKPFVLTSAWRGQAISGKICRKSPYFFHTDIGTGEGIQIDLQSAFVVDEIVVHNRTDTCCERAIQLRLSLGLDRNPRVTQTIKTPDDFLQGKRLTVSQRFEPMLARHAFLFSAASTYLHLSGIEIVGFYPSYAPTVGATHKPFRRS